MFADKKSRGAHPFY